MRRSTHSPDPSPHSGGPPGIELNPIWNAVVHEPTTGVAIVSQDGVTVWANPQAVRIFHGPECTPDMIIGRPWTEFFPPEWIAERLALLRLKLTGVAPKDASYPRRTPDRWHRRYQAEHTGDLAHLGASRAWTRTGAFIKHTRKAGGL